MITLIHKDVTVRSNALAAILHSTDLIRALAVQMVANQAEATLELINDEGAALYGTFKDVSEIMADSKAMTVEYAEDILAEFRTSLLAEIARVTIDTKAVILKPDGEIDADVVVTIA